MFAIVFEALVVVGDVTGHVVLLVQSVSLVGKITEVSTVGSSLGGVKPAEVSGVGRGGGGGGSECRFSSTDEDIK